MSSAQLFQSSDAATLAGRLLALTARSALPAGRLTELYWQFHPRYRFFKTVPRDSRFLDVGAAQGNLAQWKRWLEPLRPDIEMYGVDLDVGAHNDLYAGWEVVNLDHGLPHFGGVVFDAVFSSHVIEHIKDPAAVIGWAAARTRPGGRLYIEWPNVTTLTLPRRADLAAAGFDVMISNFHDDSTHIHLPRLGDICEIAAGAGFVIRESGVIDVGSLAEDMIATGRAVGDSGLVLCGFWSLAHWSTYLIAERCA